MDEHHLLAHVQNLVQAVARFCYCLDLAEDNPDTRRPGTKKNFQQEAGFVDSDFVSPDFATYLHRGSRVCSDTH